MTAHKGVTIRDADTGEVMHRLPTDHCCSGAAFSPNGRWLAVMADAKIELWELATGRQGRSIEGAAGSGGAVRFSSAVFTPDSRYLISVQDGGGFRLWDTFTGQEVRKWPLPGADHIAISPDGRWLAVIAAQDLTVWRRTD